MSCEGKIKDQFDLDASLSERTKAAQELLKRNVDDRKMNLELAKLEAQFKDNGSDEDAKDNFMDALNSQRVRCGQMMNNF